MADYGTLKYKQYPFSTGNKTVIPGDFSLGKWNEILKALSLGQEEAQVDLRNMSSQDLLSSLFPILTSPDMGVTLEYDLTEMSALFDECDSLIKLFSIEVGRMSSAYLARAYKISGNTVLKDNASDPVRDYYTQFITDMRAYNARVRAVSGTDTSAYTGIKESIDSAAGPQSVKGYSGGFDGVDSARNGAEIIFSKLIQDLRTGNSQNVDEAVQGFKKIIDGLVSAQASSEVENKRLLVRLFPSNAVMLLGTPKINTVRLSHTRFVQSKVREQNIIAALSGNVALDTLDTQWFGFYSELFSRIIDYGNPKCTLRAGLNRLEDCYLMEPLDIRKINDGPVQSFDINIISSRTGTDISQ